MTNDDQGRVFHDSNGIAIVTWLQPGNEGMRMLCIHQTQRFWGIGRQTAIAHLQVVRRRDRYPLQVR